MNKQRATYTREELDKIAKTELGLESVLSALDLGTTNRKVDRYIGHTSSWAVWPDPATIGDQRWASWISRHGAQDVLGLADDDVLADLHPDCVFLALNKGKPERKEQEDKMWSCFHVSVQDAKLPRALWPAEHAKPLAPYWGGYMTDLFKGLPTASGAGLKALLSTQRKSPKTYPYLQQLGPTGQEAAFQVRNGVIKPLPRTSDINSGKESIPGPEDLRSPLEKRQKDAVLDAMAKILALELERIGADRNTVCFVLLGGDAEEYAHTLFGRDPLAHWRDAFESRHAKVPHYSSSVTLNRRPGEISRQTYHEAFLSAQSSVEHKTES